MTDTDDVDRNLLEQAFHLKDELKRRMGERRLSDYTPYEKQQAFHEAGNDFRERLFMAGNQVGKTVAGGYEIAIHLTGDYPDWWQGRRFDRPVRVWAAGVTAESTRDNPQRILFGTRDGKGGAVPPGAIGEKHAARGVANAIDTVTIRHRSGGESTISFKSYERGREKWQGETLDIVWFDEEPPFDVYMEGLTRTNALGGMVMMTFTPLKGMTGAVSRFLVEKPGSCHVTRMSIEEAGHYSAEEAAAIIAGYPVHERDARVKGLPVLGSGRVFPIAEDRISVSPFPIPPHWPEVAGIDFGWDHPTAAVRLVHDRDADTVYVTDTYRRREETPLYHAAKLKAWGEYIPFSWPHDGLQHDKGSGQQLKEQYRGLGLRMLPNRAAYEDGSSGLEASIMDVLQRMQSDRFKVFNHLEDWFEEFRLYHRKDGIIVKKRDDLMSATRYALMSLRHARIREDRRWAGKTPRGIV